MKKNTKKRKFSIILKIISFYIMFIGALLVIVGITQSYKEDPIEKMSDICISDINDYKTIYIEELHVLERYAFETIDEYSDSEGSYTDTTYRVYDASQPMDNNDLHSEYYIVMFCDKTGKSYITSMSVSASKNMSQVLNNGPVKIHACISAAPISDGGLLNSWDEELIQLREKSLDSYSAKNSIPRTNITIGYLSENITQYQEESHHEFITSKILALVFGILAIIGGVGLFVYTKRKYASQT